jgi:hypothetical protein
MRYGLWCYNVIIIWGVYYRYNSHGKSTSIGKTERAYLKRSWQFFKKISQSCLRKKFQMLQGLSRYWRPTFETYRKYRKLNCKGKIDPEFPQKL